MRQLATIQQIADIQPIEGADRIEKVKVKDWWCVSEKGNFKVGDLCVYFEIDSLLPSSNPAFAFLEKGTKQKTMNIEGKEYAGYRLKTIRLRGQISQGLALPLSVAFDSTVHPYNTGDIGYDVSDILNVVKYEAPIPANLSGKVKGNFPGFLPKTDEERVQNIGAVIERSQGKVFYVTEKLDGTSATFYRHIIPGEDSHFGVCSRNLELLETDGNTFWEIAKKYNLVENLPEGFAIQGEIVGEGIQKNPLRIAGRELYVFNVYNITEGRYLNFDELRSFCALQGLKMVPIIHESFTMEASVEELLQMANGKSALCDTAAREGLVFRPLKEELEHIGGQDRRFSFKVISNDYLLKNEE